jgi:hypothetical protein
VQFGCAQAVEYEIDAPSAKLTPMPAELAQKRFPLADKQEDNEEEKEEIEETKENSAVLAEWEEDFDSFMEDDDQDELPRKHRSRRKHRSKKKHRKDTRSDRRRSSAFCSPNNSKALFDPSSDDIETTPDKQNAMVVDTMAHLSMASPSPARHDSKEDGQADVAGSTSMSPSSPVLAKSLSPEARMGSSEEESDKETSPTNIVTQLDEADSEFLSPPPPAAEDAFKVCTVVFNLY